MPMLLPVILGDVKPTGYSSIEAAPVTSDPSDTPADTKDRTEHCATPVGHVLANLSTGTGLEEPLVEP